MKHYLALITLCFLSNFAFGQFGDCNQYGEACSNPSFTVTASGSGNDIDFTTADNISNPLTNVNSSPGNAGCLQSGELNSTWLQINVTSSGTLEFSLGDGAPSNFDCYDWALWPLNTTTCDDITNNTLAPVACNWNGTCNGFTGIADPGNIPTPGTQDNFENALNVVAGEQYIICFSNYSGTSTNIPLDFFGSASVTCGSVTDATICAGETAIITAFDGNTYSWDTSIPGFIGTNAAGDTAYVNPTVTTNYDVEIIQAAGNSIFETSVVTVYPAITINVTPVSETCTGDGNGSLTFSTVNGVAPFTYTLSGTSSANNSNGVFNNLASGNYTIDIVDANGCTAQLSTTLAPGPPCCGMVLTTSHTDNSCFGECSGIASLDTTGTTGPAPIQWFDPSGTSIPGANTLSINGLCAGVYTVEVADPLCTLTETVTISDPAELTITEFSTDLKCFQDASGEISITANGGTSPYEYSLDNGASFVSTSVFSNLSADLYNIVVKDDNNCSKNIQVTLGEPSIMQENILVQDNICNIINAPCTGEIDVIINGGTAPFSYSWNNGLTPTSNPTGVCSNNYNLTVTDANGCVLNVSNILVTEPAAVTIDNVISDSPLCYSDCDGSVIIENSNATKFSIDGGNSFQVSNEFLSLCSGDYSITISNDDGCTYSEDISLLSPGAVLAAFTFGPQPTSTQNPEITFINTSINADSEFWYTVINDDTVTIHETNTTILFPNHEPGNYEVCLVASNTNLCIDTICETVVIDDDFFIFVPNTFSPNNDGVNDIFYPVVNSYNKTNFEFLIFNRWGELIFESNSPLVGWKGTHNSLPVKSDTYIWKINTESETDGTPQTFTGHVNLIR